MFLTLPFGVAAAKMPTFPRNSAGTFIAFGVRFRGSRPVMPKSIFAVGSSFQISSVVQRQFQPFGGKYFFQNGSSFGRRTPSRTRWPSRTRYRDTSQILDGTACLRAAVVSQRKFHRRELHGRFSHDLFGREFRPVYSRSAETQTDNAHAGARVFF